MRTLRVPEVKAEVADPSRPRPEITESTRGLSFGAEPLTPGGDSRKGPFSAGLLALEEEVFTKDEGLLTFGGDGEFV